MEVFIEYLDSTKQNWWDEQWLITIVVAILPILLTFFMNFKQENSNKKFKKEMVQMQIDADITAKARIEWIQNARNITVDFINSCYSLIKFMDINEMSNVEQGTPQKGVIASALVTLNKKASEKFKTYDNDKKYIFEGQADVQRYGILLELYFGPDRAKENEFIVYLIDDIIKKLTSNNSIFEGQDLMIIMMIDDLKDALRAYYKIEWKRASGSYKDDEVNKALNGENLYRYVKDKYEAPFMNNGDLSKKDAMYELIDNKYIEINC